MVETPEDAANIDVWDSEVRAYCGETLIDGLTADLERFDTLTATEPSGTDLEAIAIGNGGTVLDRFSDLVERDSLDPSEYVLPPCPHCQTISLELGSIDGRPYGTCRLCGNTYALTERKDAPNA